MARTTKAKSAQPLTTAQRLSSIVKSCRDVMRKDKGLNGDLDRLPMLTWIMFLKFLDDMEQIRQEEAKMSGKRFRAATESPYRWRDWAAKEDGITGDELIAFVNNEEAVRPDGSKGAGLFAYLRSLQGANGGDRRDVIATVFKGTINRMINGYLLRDVINKVSGIHFTSSDEIHTLGHLYESMLKEMRDAAGDSGEFYTPRAVVRFMVEVVDPKLGEVILDPACGTGGFLVELFRHLEKQCKTVEDRQVLQSQTIFGGEAKPLPYLLAQMNLVLHGLESPKIDPLNSLRFPLREIGDKDRVDIIMTNPPFGGEEERGILGNFPEDKQTSETALLFLQLIMRKLRRPGSPSPARGRGQGEGHITAGRAAVVVPNGTLFGDGICARIRILGAHWYAEGLYLKDTLPGSQIRADKLFRVEKGDFVYNRLFAWKGSFAVATANDGECYVSNEFPCFSINQDQADATYLWRYFSRLSAWEEALGLSSGGTPTSRNRLKEEKFLAIQIPLPSRSEQRRIVARIEELAAKINEARELRRQAVEEAEALRRGHASKLFNPEFKRQPIEEVAEIRGGIQKGPDRIPSANPVRYLTVAHVQRNQVLTHDRRYFEVTAEELDRWRLLTGDVLIIEGNGSAEQIGRTALFRGEIDNCVHQNHVIRIRPNSAYLFSEFLNLFLNSPVGQDAVQAQSRTTSGLRTLSVGRIKQIQVPVPPLSHQRRIVTELNALHAQADALKKLQTETAAVLDALLPSILDKAFKGEL